MKYFYKLKKIIHRGFTLLELMVVIAIIGILATIGTMEYGYYIARAQATEAINLLAQVRTTVIDFYDNNGRSPSFPEVVYMNPFLTPVDQPTPSQGDGYVEAKYISVIGTSDGAGVMKIQAVFKTTGVHSKLAGQKIRFVSPKDPTLSQSFHRWKCQTTISAEYYQAVPEICRNAYVSGVAGAL